MNFEVLSKTIQRDKKHKMLYAPLKFENYSTHALLDTGGVKFAMFESELKIVTVAHPAVFRKEIPAPTFEKQLANWNLNTAKKATTNTVFHCWTGLWRFFANIINHGNSTHEHVIVWKVFVNPSRWKSFHSSPTEILVVSQKSRNRY